MEVLNGWKNPTYAERLAAVVEGRGSMNFMAAAKQQLSLRLPLETLVRVDAFSMSAGMSRNSMIEHLLNAGMEAASAHLDEETLEQLSEYSASQFSLLLEQDIETIRGDE